MRDKLNIIQKYLNINIWITFFIIYLIYSISLVLESHFIYTDSFLINIIGIDKTSDSLKRFIALKKELFWINYFILVLIIWFPTLAIAFCFKVGAILNNTSIKYKHIVNLTLKSQLIGAVNYFIFTFLKLNHLIERNVNNLNNCYDYQSILALLSDKHIPYWLLYPLQLVSISELLSMIFYTYGIHILFKYTKLKAVKFYFVFYGVGLLFWIVLTIFLQTFIN